MKSVTHSPDPAVKKNSNSATRTILFAVFLLVIAGWIMLLDTGLVFEGQENQAHFSTLVTKRFIGSMAGLGLMLIAWLLPPKLVRHLTLPVVIIALTLLLMIWTPLGVAERGSTRWVQLGTLRFQPLEFAKLALVWFLADQFARTGLLSRIKLDRIWFPAAIAVLMIGLVAAQPNLSGAVFLICLVFAMAWLAGVNWRVTLGLAAAGAAAFFGLLALHPEKIARLIPVFKPFTDLSGSGYQVGLSLWAIVSGGWFGKGPGGSIAMYSLPDHSTDFIFSIICEEWGFVGGILVILTFTALIFSGYRIALSQRDPFRLLFGCGVTTIIGLQVVINIGVTLGLLPTTGMPLPFLSAGGSNLILSTIQIGLILNLGRTAGVGAEISAKKTSGTEKNYKSVKHSYPRINDRPKRRVTESDRTTLKRRMAR